MIGSGGRLRVEVKTVNHRHFNPALKLPGELAAIEGTAICNPLLP